MTDKVISISDRSSGQAGSIIRVPVIISDASDINGIDLHIQFDNQILTLNSVKNGDLTSGWTITPVETKKNNISTLKIGSFNSKAAPSGVGSIFILEFKINNVSVDSSSIITINNAQLFSLSNTNFDIKYDAGKITVSNQIFDNSSPVVNTPILPQEIIQNSAFNLGISNNFADLNQNETLVYSANLLDGTTLKKLPSWLTFDPDTKQLNGTPKNEDVGFFTVRVKVADGEGETAETDFTIDVKNVNDTPELVKPIADQSILINNPLNLAIDPQSFRDIDGDQLTYIATLNDGSILPNWLQFDPNNLTFSGTPTNANLGELTIKLEGTDPSNAKVSDTFNLKVIAANSVPVVVKSIPDLSTEEKDYFVFQIPPNTFADPDYDSLTYSVSLENGQNLPSWLYFNSNTLIFSGTPKNTDITTVPLSIKVTANDGKNGIVNDIFQLTVNNVNDPPIKLPGGILDQIIKENSLWNFQIPTNTFTDEDGDILSYSAILADDNFLPTWLTFNPTTLTFTGTPNDQDVGILNIKVIVDDNKGGQISDIFTLTITQVNDSPIISNPISDQNLTKNNPFNFTIPSNTFSDPDGDSLTYSVKLSNGNNLPTWLTFNPTTLTFNGTPTTVETFDINVNVTDGKGGQITDNFNLIIRDENNLFPWDINEDNIVTPTDVLFVINRLGQDVNNNKLADINGDNLINQSDVILSQIHLGETFNF